MSFNDIMTTLVGRPASAADTISISSCNPGLLMGNMVLGSSGTYTTAVSGSTTAVWPTNTITGLTTSLAPSSLSVTGDAVFDGEVTVKGKKLSDTLQRIEDRLAILHPNEALEEKWENLKGLGKAYRELEAEILEKEKIWSILKK